MIFTQIWPYLMGFSAYLFFGGWATSHHVAKNVGGAMLLAYVLMQLKKMGWPGVEGHVVSLTIWMACAAYLASLILRENYGNSLSYAAVAILLMLSGTCYLWARLMGQLSGIGVPHAIISDLLAVAAMYFAGRGLGGDLWVKFGRGFMAGNIN